MSLSREWIKQKDGFKLVASMEGWMEFRLGWEEPRPISSEKLLEVMIEPQTYGRRALKVFGYGFRWIIKASEIRWFECPRSLAGYEGVTTIKENGL